MTKARVVFFSQSTSQRFVDAAEAAQEALGKTVFITAWDDGDTVVEKWSAPRYENRSFATRAITWSKYLGVALGKTVFLRGRPVVHVTTNPPLLPHMAYVLSKVRGWPYVVHVYDIYPDVLVGRGLLSEAHLVTRVWRRLNKLAYRGASSVVTLAPGMRDRLAKDAPSASVIPIWIDTEKFRPVERSENSFAKAHDLGDTFNVLYAGNLGVTHNLDGLFAAARTLAGDDKTRFVFVGGGGREAELQALADELPNVIWLPFQSEEVAPLLMAAADLAVVALSEEAAGVSMPSKTATHLATGSPILALCSDQADLARLIREQGVGYQAAPSDAAAIVTILRRAKRGNKAMRKRARTYAEKNLERTVCIGRMVDLIKEADAS